MGEQLGVRGERSADAAVADAVDRAADAVGVAHALRPDDPADRACALATLRVATDQALAVAVRDCRRTGLSWRTIAGRLGMSHQGARDRFDDSGMQRSEHSRALRSAGEQSRAFPRP